MRLRTDCLCLAAESEGTEGTEGTEGRERWKPSARQQQQQQIVLECWAEVSLTAESKMNQLISKSTWEDINTDPPAVVSARGADTEPARAAGGHGTAKQVAFRSESYCGVMLLKRLGALCRRAAAQQQSSSSPVCNIG